jgi:Flp pilus assembly protein TadG
MVGRDGHRLKKIGYFARDEQGQNLVEFALLLPVLMYILMGIIQFGLIFAVYITINNSVREAARWGTIYVYDNTISATVNDTTRNNGIIDRIYQSRGILNIAARGTGTSNFSTAATGTYAVASCPNQTPLPELAWYYGASGTNPDVTICYARPTGVLVNDPRRGYYLDVSTYYHLQVFIPLLQQFLPDDPVKGAPWIRLPGRITVVVN